MNLFLHFWHLRRLKRYNNLTFKYRANWKYRHNWRYYARASLILIDRLSSTRSSTCLLMYVYKNDPFALCFACICSNSDMKLFILDFQKKNSRMDQYKLNIKQVIKREKIITHATILTMWGPCFWFETWSWHNLKVRPSDLPTTGVGVATDP